MECTHPDIVTGGPHEGNYPPFHLISSLVRKRERKDRLRPDTELNKIRCSVGENSCLAAASTGNDNDRTVNCFYSFLLSRVKLVEK